LPAKNRLGVFSCGCDAPSSPVPTRSKNAGLMQWTHAQPRYQG